MNKQELIAKISEKANLPKKTAGEAIDALVSSVIESVAAGESVQLIGFGTFELRKREARTGHNPRTGEAVKIAATNVPAFKAGKGFKDACNAKKKSKKK